MSSPNDWNAKVIAEFRANDGKVGGSFEGASMILVHHTGRKSGMSRVSPMVCLRDEDDPDTVYVFASKAGAPDNPDWYYNLTSGAPASAEVGTPEGIETYPVTVTELEEPDRQRIYDAQVQKLPGFADYARKVEGIRSIPVLALRRA